MHELIKFEKEIRKIIIKLLKMNLDELKQLVERPASLTTETDEMNMKIVFTEDEANKMITFSEFDKEGMIKISLSTKDGLNNIDHIKVNVDDLKHALRKLTCK